MNPGTDREVRMIERSLAAFRHCLLGLLPIIGGPWAIAAVRGYIHARAAGRGLWNPAAIYALAGFFLGLVGLAWFAVQILAGAGIALAIAS